MTEAHRKCPKTARFLSARLSDAVRHGLALTACAGCVLALAHGPAALAQTPAAQMQTQTPAQAPAAMTQVCTLRANNAKLIAEDRDKGVSQQDELRKAQGVVAAMPIERQLYAQAELATFINRLYGQYAKMPPQEAHDKYLAFCEREAASGAAQVQ